MPADPRPKLGLLVMAYGTPESPDDLEPYYTHIRGGRAPDPEALADLIERYKLIGGSSPLNIITRRQAVGTAKLVTQRLGIAVTAYVGMRHAPPFIGEVVKQMAADGVERAVALVMTPQYSVMSVAAYQRDVQTALDALANPFPVTYVDHWHRHPGFVQALARRVEYARAELPKSTRAEAMTVFTAHSLPERLVERGDPYARHLEETAADVAAAAGVVRWQTAYQSASSTGVPWLGPDICDVIAQLAQDGVPGIVVCPAGFVADHLEIFYDIDIEARDAALNAGIAFARTASLNDAPDFLEALADIVINALQTTGERI